MPSVPEICDRRLDRPLARSLARWLFAVLVCGLVSATAGARPLATGGDSAAQPKDVAVPGFWDPRRRPERPDLSRLQTIRFLTGTDYPPFDYTGPDGNPAGFNIDLARAICEEIKVT
jgi:polar amino acid transport system substrate-binding protein